MKKKDAFTMQTNYVSIAKAHQFTPAPSNEVCSPPTLRERTENFSIFFLAKGFNRTHCYCGYTVGAKASWKRSNGVIVHRDSCREIKRLRT
jgi:hypothetical protein